MSTGLSRFDTLLPLVDKIEGLAMPWKPWMEKLIAGCGGMSAPRWNVPHWMPSNTEFDPNDLVRKYFEHVDDFEDPQTVQRRQAERSEGKGRVSAGMADGTVLSGLPRASGIVALIKSRFCGCIAEIYQFEPFFKGINTETATFPQELQELVRHALRYALFLIAIGGRRHISEDELEFVYQLAVFSPPVSHTPA